MPHMPKTLAACAVLALAASTLAACGGGSDSTSDAGASVTATAAPGSEYSLASVCPSTVVIQTDWNPESEQGGLYQLVGPDPSIDTSKKTVTSKLVAHGGVDTGVKVEIRAGGPAIAYQAVAQQMYTDPSIMLGSVATDEAMVASSKTPVVGVAALMEKNPQIIMWDQAKHPEWKTIADIGKAKAKVIYSQGAAFMAYLTSKGILHTSQLDGSYDGSPATFVAGGGDIAMQAYATAEPYIYEHEVSAWNKPVAYQLVADYGYSSYVSSVSVRTDKLQSDSACLKKLVPIMQQAEVDFVTSPATTNDLILDLVTKYNTGWAYSPGVAKFSVDQQLELGIVGNGSDKALGNFDMTRLSEIVAIENDLLTKANVPVKDGLEASDIATNEFIDPSIGLAQ